MTQYLSLGAEDQSEGTPFSWHMSAMMLSIASRAVGLLLTVVAVSASAQSPTSAIQAELAPTGTLRAAINFNNPLLAKRDAATGELSGLAVDLSRELGRRAGVPVDLIPYDAAGRISDAVKTREWDVAYLAIDPARAADIEFTAPYLELEGTYLVPEGSRLQNIADVDREGVRIAVTEKSAYDLFLSRELKHAQLVRAATTPISIDMMSEHKADAVAAVRTALVAGARRVSGARVLNGHFMTIPQAAGVPKGRPVAARYVREFIEEMKGSGFVTAGLASHGLGPDDAIVAPLAAAYVATYVDVTSSSISEAATLLARYERATRSEAGNVAIRTLREEGRANRFVVVEAWRDQASLAAHAQAPHTLELREKLRPLQRGPYDQRVTHGLAVDPRPLAAGRLYVVTHVDVPKASRPEAEALLKQLFEKSRSDRGNVHYDVYQQNEPSTNHFTIVAVWDSQRALDAYGSTPHSLQFREALAPLLGALYDERLYQAIRR
jgi:polar amino acid transport system substrate-binding protein